MPVRDCSSDEITDEEYYEMAESDLVVILEEVSPNNRHFRIRFIDKARWYPAKEKYMYEYQGEIYNPDHEVVFWSVGGALDYVTERIRHDAYSERYRETYKVDIVTAPYPSDDSLLPQKHEDRTP